MLFLSPTHFVSLLKGHWPFILCNTLIGLLLTRFHAFLSPSYVPRSKVEPLASGFILWKLHPGFEAAIGLYSDCMTPHCEDLPTRKIRHAFSSCLFFPQSAAALRRPRDHVLLSARESVHTWSLIPQTPLIHCPRPSSPELPHHHLCVAQPTSQKSPVQKLFGIRFLLDNVRIRAL